MDVPQRGFRILRIDIGRAAIILSPPENLQCVYRPLQELCQDFGRRRYCLRCAILLDADNGWRCLADLILLLQLKIGKHRTAEKIGYKLGLMLQFPHK